MYCQTFCITVYGDGMPVCLCPAATLHPQVSCGYGASQSGGFRGQLCRTRGNRPQQEALLQEKLQRQTHYLRSQNQVRVRIRWGLGSVWNPISQTPTLSACIYTPLLFIVSWEKPGLTVCHPFPLWYPHLCSKSITLFPNTPKLAMTLYSAYYCVGGSSMQLFGCKLTLSSKSACIAWRSMLYAKRGEQKGNVHTYITRILAINQENHLYVRVKNNLEFYSHCVPLPQISILLHVSKNIPSLFLSLPWTAEITLHLLFATESNISVTCSWRLEYRQLP